MKQVHRRLPNLPDRIVCAVRKGQLLMTDNPDEVTCLMCKAKQDDKLSVDLAAPRPWRVFEDRIILDAHDNIVGMMDAKADAALLVDAVNADAIE
jgi:hypothetical protein